MQCLAFVAPLPAGHTDAERSALASCWAGDRREAHQDSRRRAGITREAVWFQSCGGEGVAVVYLEADDVAAAARVLGRSGEPFDRWFRDHARYVRVLALDAGFVVPELVLDFDIDQI